jgi:hypothetical protein
VAGEIEAKGRRALAQPTDIGDEASVAALFARIEEVGVDHRLPGRDRQFVEFDRRRADAGIVEQHVETGRPEPLQAVAGEIEAKGRRALAQPTDIGDEASVG